MYINVFVYKFFNKVDRTRLLLQKKNVLFYLLSLSYVYCDLCNQVITKYTYTSCEIQKFSI